MTRLSFGRRCVCPFAYRWESCNMVSLAWHYAMGSPRPSNECALSRRLSTFIKGVGKWREGEGTRGEGGCCGHENFPRHRNWYVRVVRSWRSSLLDCEVSTGTNYFCLVTLGKRVGFSCNNAFCRRTTALLCLLLREGWGVCPDSSEVAKSRVVVTRNDPPPHLSGFGSAGFYLVTGGDNVYAPRGIAC